MRVKIRGKRLVFILLTLILGTAALLLITKLVRRPVFSKAAKTRHLIVISIDALNAKDFDIIEDMTNFKELINSGSYAKEVAGVYPSLTYPSHTSIITGAYPDKHGIYANELNEPGINDQRWYWYKKYVKADTLYEEAEKSKMKVGALFWPVMAGAKVDYNCPEIWPVNEEKSQTWLSLKNGTPLFLFQINSKFGKLLNGQSQPELDNFIAKSASYMITSRKPNLSLIHFTELDHTRHKKGFMSKEIPEVLKREDERIGEIINAVKNAGILDDTTFIVLGDHGFADVDNKICLNTEFARQGLIDLDNKGKIKDWKAYANYCDGSCQIFLKDSKDITSLAKVQEILYKLKDDPSSGIKNVYTKEEAALKHVTGDFVFMLEAKDKYYFSNTWVGDLIQPIDKSLSTMEAEQDDNYYVATHGYDPMKKGYRTFFLASGSGIKKGVVLPSIDMIDEGPTMAELLGLKLKDADGHPIDAIIN